METFEHLFTKKEETNNKTPLETNIDCLEQAEKLSDIVSLEVDRENYKELNQQLTTFIPQEAEREKYIFAHPRIESKVIAVITCSIFLIIYLYFLFISASTTLLSQNHLFVGIAGIIISVLLLTINIVLIRKLIASIKYKHRYDMYVNLLKFRSFEFVNDLTILSKQKEKDLVLDLNNAVKQKLIPQGHFSKENLVFMTSNNIYNKYIEKQPIYDRYFKKLIEERNRMKNRTDEISRIMELGTQYVEKIQNSKAIIKDKSVSKKLEHMETIVSMIFYEVDANPSQATSLSLFLNYYLPTTEKLIEAYISIGEKQIIGGSLPKTKKEIENSLNTIILAFENILERLYKVHEMDISSDITAMEIMMKQEGLTD